MNITIIGCGWLGHQLGASLIDNGYRVYGSFRSVKTKEALLNIGILPFKWEASASSRTFIDTAISQETDVLVICLPPSSVEDYPKVLVETMNHFGSEVKVIFTSSTGIYPKKDGEFDETYEFKEEEKQSVLYRAEEGLRKVLNSRLTILRLGGLIGPARHPIKYVSGKSYPDDGSSPINLIDSRDINRLVNRLIKNEEYGGLFNVVCPSYQSKKNYYKHLAKYLNIECPVYGLNKGIQRVIKSESIVKSIGFQYKFDVQNFDTQLIFA